MQLFVYIIYIIIYLFHLFLENHQRRQLLSYKSKYHIMDIVKKLNTKALFWLTTHLWSGDDTEMQPEIVLCFQVAYIGNGLCTLDPETTMG